MDSEPTNQLLRWNDEPIINQLPIELLMMIFESALGPRDHGHGSVYYRHLCALLKVCTRWYSIVRHSPQLWVTVPGAITEDGLRMILERSSGKHIDIECNHDGVHFTTFFDILGSVSGLAHPQCHEDGYGRSNLQLSATPSSQFGATKLPKQLLGPDRREPAFKGLEVLKISTEYFESLEPILDIIRPLPQLRKLEIDDCVIEGEVSTPIQPVSLPNLQVLRVDFDEREEVISPTKQFLGLVSAPPPCQLYACSRAFDQEDDDSIVATFCEWLFGRQTKEVLEGVERLKVGFGPEDGLVTIELLSGSASIKGCFIRWLVKKVIYVLRYIQGLFKQSNATETSTILTLSGEMVYYISNSEVASFKELPPITHLELIQPEWPSPNSSSEDISDLEDSAPSTGSAFSMIRNVVLREISPDSILDIVLGALGDSRERARPISGWRVEDLDHIEIHVDEKDFHGAEAVVEALRSDPRIGKVDLYVAL
ncbi:hypothetical protein FRC01_002798 [Tulasnella sp. 417]|nr:hypothetical protein FRC01_002798 [Tulasnella sp. 417]